MKPVVLSQHARRRLEWLDVSEDEVRDIFLDPGYVTPHEGQAYAAYVSRNLRTLRVAVREEAQHLLVTTVTSFGPPRSKQ
ncbi:MAG TPA: hypothetical protein VK009_23980 [Chloroflexota bacterium]|nr:hypothetical protein [Chloroflexota bacterium]